MVHRSSLDRFYGRFSIKAGSATFCRIKFIYNSIVWSAESGGGS